MNFFSSFLSVALSISPSLYFSSDFLGEARRWMTRKFDDNGSGSKLCKASVCMGERKMSYVCICIYIHTHIRIWVCACVILCTLSVLLLLYGNSRGGEASCISIAHQEGIEQKTAIFWLVDLSVISLLSLSPSLCAALSRSLARFPLSFSTAVEIRLILLYRRKKIVHFLRRRHFSQRVLTFDLNSAVVDPTTSTVPILKLSVAAPSRMTIDRPWE